MAHKHGSGFSIDLYAFHSKLKHINPEYKLICALITLILTIIFNNIYVSAYVLLGMFFISVKLGGTYLVAIPKMAVIHIQNTAPGPPVTTAVATPAMLPVPMVADRAVIKAAKWEISPSWSSPSSVVFCGIKLRDRKSVV